MLSPEYNHLATIDSLGNDVTAAAKPDTSITGKDRDEVTGLLYFNARWYDAQVGKFLGVAAYPRNQEHPFTFCASSPAVMVDADGEREKKKPDPELKKKIDFMKDACAGKIQEGAQRDACCCAIDHMMSYAKGGRGGLLLFGGPIIDKGGELACLNAPLPSDMNGLLGAYARGAAEVVEEYNSFGTPGVPVPKPKPKPKPKPGPGRPF